MTRITGILREDQYTFILVPRLILRRMSNVSDKSYRENQSTHFILGNTFPKIVLSMTVILNRRAAAWYRALASIIPGRERPEATSFH